MASGGNGHFYEMIHYGSPITLAVTTAECNEATAMSYQGAPGYLATNSLSSAQNQFIYNNVIDPTNHAWFGGKQGQQGGAWSWQNGDPWGYVAWDGGQPDGFGGWPQHTFFHRGILGWHDSHETWVDLPTRYVVEYCSPTTCEAEGVGCGLIPDGCGGILDCGNCNDNNPCTDDSCSPTFVCLHASNTGPCSDGNACTVGDVCAGGTCQPGGTPLNCNDGNDCTVDSCSPAPGCIHALLPNNTDCSDGDACTIGDRCHQGACRPGHRRNCRDSDPCTYDRCDPHGGCISQPIPGCH